MKIKRQNSEKVEVSTLDVGDCFEFANELFLVIKNNFDDIVVDKPMRVLVVNLGENELDDFTPSTHVKKVNAKIVAE